MAVHHNNSAAISFIKLGQQNYTMPNKIPESEVDMNKPQVEWIGQSFSVNLFAGQVLRIMLDDGEVMNFVVPTDYKLSCYLNRRNVQYPTNFGNK